MALWLVLYVLLIVVLVGVAIYEHVKTTSLSLPVSPSLTILAILLPLIAAANAFYYPQLVRQASKSTSTIQRLLPTGLQVIQLIFTAILATLFYSDFVPSSVRECLLETEWKHFWTDHDADAIRNIQDAFNCCGFRTVKDRAWPFPYGTPEDSDKHVDCVRKYNRDTPCKGQWEGALQQNTGMDFGVVIVVALLQLASVYFMKKFEGASASSILGRLFRLFMRSTAARSDSASPRLLVGGPVEVVGDGDGERYRDEEHGTNERDGNGYGATGR